MEKLIRALDKSDSADQAIYDQLRSAIWPDADREHFGENLPSDFFDSKPILFVCEVGGVPAGYLSAETDAGVVHIKSTAVLGSHRRQGIARALKEALENEARRLNCHKIDTEVGVGWDSEKLNVAMGYQVVALRRNHYGKRDFYLMEKILD